MSFFTGIISSLLSRFSILQKFKPRSLLSKLMISHSVVVIITLLVMGLFLTYQIENYFFGAREIELTGQARDVAYLLEQDFYEDDIEEVQKTAKTLALSLDVKIRVLDDGGELLTVISPEEEDEEEGEGEGYADSSEGVGLEDSEIDHVLEGNMYTKKVYGPHMQRLLVAAPIEGNNQDGGSSEEIGEDEVPPIKGLVTLSAPLWGVEETISQISKLIFYSGLIGALAAGLLAFSLAKKMTSPLQKISRAALDMASGDFRQKISQDTDDEIGDLARTFNYSVKQVEKTIEEQKRLEEFRRQLVANVSHELRAPLSSMRGFAELMLDGLIKEEEKEKYLKIILDNSIHLSRLVEDLMDLSRLESGHVNLNFESLDPLEPARLSVESIMPQGNEKGIRLNLHAEKNLPAVKADRSRLHEILINLLENAIEYSPPGEQVNLNLYYEKGHLVYEVIDRGKGIPAEDLDYVWERFYKVDKSRRRTEKGSGLGLAITRQLVEMHQGRVEAESKPGKGSTFRVYLPVQP